MSQPNSHLDKAVLSNLDDEIWKSAERLRGKFKAHEYQVVVLPAATLDRLETEVSYTHRHYIKDDEYIPSMPKGRHKTAKLFEKRPRYELLFPDDLCGNLMAGQGQHSLLTLNRLPSRSYINFLY
jgi:hypothetical protein